MNGNRPNFPTLSTKAKTVQASRSSAKCKSTMVVPKSQKSPIKASKSLQLARSRLVKATERRSKCMETSSKLSKYFAKPKEVDVELSDPICLSSDDGEPTSTQVDRDNRRREARTRFLDCEAGCDEDSPVHSEEEEGNLSGGFIVSDGHLSSDEDSDPWHDCLYARRVGESPVHSPRTKRTSSRSKEAEKERESPVPEWSPCGQPPSPPMSPIELDDEDVLTDLDVVPNTPVSVEDVEEEELPEPGEDAVEIPGKPFRLQNQFVHLIYKSHLPKDHYTKFLKDTMGISGMKIQMAHETADKTCPYLHTHVVVDFTRRINVFNVHKFCYVNPEKPDKKDKCGKIHCFIKRLYGVQAYKDCLVYIAKEDPANAHLKKSKDEVTAEKGMRLVQNIQSASNVNVALKQNLRRIGDAAGIIQIYQRRNIVSTTLRVPDRPNRPWQVELLDQVEGQLCPWSDRKIIWYVDKVGNTGKSWFSRYMARANVSEDAGFDWLCLNAVDEDKDVYHQIKEAMDTGYTCKGFIIDVARSSKFKQKLYKALESVKNGSVTATKYQGARLEFNVPWVIVFANFWPNTQQMSSDRWDIRRISPETCVAEKLPLNAEAYEEFKHCASCTCNQHAPRPDILQERV